MIYIRKNEIFYENNLEPGHKDYVMTKVQSVIPYLDDVVHIDNKITLEDFLAIVEKDEEIMNIIFGSHLGHYLLRPFLDEIKKDCMAESKEEMEYIKCSWFVEPFDYQKIYEKYKDEESDSFLGRLSKPTGDEVNEINIYVDVHGWGRYLPQEDEVYKDGEDPPTHVSYGIEFTPLYRLKHLPIKLNKEFVIKTDFGVDGPILVQGEKEFSVFEVFGSILSEITFAGLPEDRDDQWKNVLDDHKEYKEREEGEDE